MNTIASKASAESDVAPRARRRFRKPVAALLVAGAIAAGSLTAAQPASAYSYTAAGTYNAAILSPMYVNGAGSLYPTLRQLSAPGVTVRSTLPSGSAKWQTVYADFTLQRWNPGTRTWTSIWSSSRSATLLGGQWANLYGNSFGNWSRGFYYRALVNVRWYTNSTVNQGARDPLTGALIPSVVTSQTGRVEFTPDRTADQVCTAAYCTSYAGSVWVG